jgi:hypothetical protein
VNGRVCAAMRRQDLTKSEECGEKSASSSQWAAGHRNQSMTYWFLKQMS